MSTIAQNIENPSEKGGLLSRMFNALTPKFLKDYIGEIKQELKAIDREKEWHRQDTIKDAAIDIIQNSTPENYDRDIQKILDMNKQYKESNFFDCGEITFEDIRNQIDNINEKGAHSHPSQSVQTATFEA